MHGHEREQDEIALRCENGEQPVRPTLPNTLKVIPTSTPLVAAHVPVVCLRVWEAWSWDIYERHGVSETAKSGTKNREGATELLVIP